MKAKEGQARGESNYEELELTSSNTFRIEEKLRKETKTTTN